MRRWLRRTPGFSELGTKIDETLSAVESRLEHLRGKTEERDQSILKRIDMLQLQIGDLQVEISSLRADFAREMETLHDNQGTSKT